MKLQGKLLKENKKRKARHVLSLIKENTKTTLTKERNKVN